MRLMKKRILYSVQLITVASLLLSGCGQSGKLFLPGEGKGYYRTHEFTQRPVVAGPEKKH